MIEITTDYNRFFKDAEQNGGFYLYGAGTHGESVGRVLLKANLDFNGYIDANPTIIAGGGVKILQKEVIPPREIQNRTPVYIFSTLFDWPQMCYTLEEYGVNAVALVCGPGGHFNYALSPARNKRLQHHDFSIICNNCVGGVICKALGVRENSPTVNMIIEPEDFLKFAGDVKSYLAAPLQFSHMAYHSIQHYPYPVAKCSDIDVHFVYSKDFESAKAEWDHRKGRVISDKIIFILSDVYQNNVFLSQEAVERFMNMPHKRAYTFLHQTHSVMNENAFANCGNLYYFPSSFNFFTNCTPVYEAYFDLAEWLNKALDK